MAPPPPQAQAPSVPPAVQMAAMIPPLPALPPYEPRLVILDTSVPPEHPETSHARLRHPNKRHPKPATTEAVQPETKPPVSPEAAAPAASPAVAETGSSDASPLGQFSPPNDSANASDRHAILNLIDSTENGLNEIKRPLSSSEQKTAAQIRTFITHARDALKTGDLDGARTLATKAHLLLQELTQE